MNNSNNTKLGDLYAVMSIPNETQLGHVKTEEELKACIQTYGFYLHSHEEEYKQVKFSNALTLYSPMTGDHQVKAL